MGRSTRESDALRAAGDSRPGHQTSVKRCSAKVAGGRQCIRIAGHEAACSLTQSEGVVTGAATVLPDDSANVPRTCTSFRHVPGQKQAVRCGRPATFRLPNYFVHASKGYRDSYSCDECAARQRLQGMRTVEL